MNKKLIRLTENDLHKIIKESVNRIISESIGNGLSDEFKDEMRKYYQSKGWSEEQIKGLFNDIVDHFINRGYTEEDFANLWRIRYYQDKQKKLAEILGKIFREYACWNSETNNNNIFKIEASAKENLMNGVRELKKYGYEPIKITKGSEFPYGGRASYKVDVWYAYYERTV